MEEDFDDTTMDACLIAAAQRVEHYEMAAYGTLVAWARAMGHTKAADLLEQTLDEEKAADEKLSSLAEGGIDQEAADAAHPNGAEQERKKRSHRRSNPRVRRRKNRHDADWRRNFCEERASVGRPSPTREPLGP